jgi:calcineurin-like phosphoesterase family protein
MIKIDKDFKGEVWCFSDPHYNHKNICRGTTDWRLPDNSIPINQTRDFPTLDRMNSTIVDNINEVVMQDDILICLGDWSFGGFENIQKFRDRIICEEIHLILGNHDHHIENNRQGCQRYFKSVSHYNTLEYKNRAGETHKFVLCHYPICSWHDMKKGVYHLFGHLHTPKQNKIMNGRSMDVGMDGNDLKPYNINDIVRTLSGRPITFNILKDDHHLDDIKGIVG